MVLIFVIKAMYKFILFTTFLLIILSLASCNSSRSEVKKELNSTTDDSEIFFKNVRQLYYSVNENSSAHLNTYKLKKQPASQYPEIKIIHNWSEDKAYVMLSFEEELILTLTNECDSTFHFNGNSMTNHLKCADFIFFAIKNGCTIISANDSLKILSTPEEKKAFTVTMKDFYNLTNRK